MNDIKDTYATMDAASEPEHADHHTDDVSGTRSRWVIRENDGEWRFTTAGNVAFVVGGIILWLALIALGAGLISWARYGSFAAVFLDAGRFWTRFALSVPSGLIVLLFNGPLRPRIRRIATLGQRPHHH